MEEVRNKFAELHNHGTKVYKFQQRKSFTEITEDNFVEDYERVRHGSCVGITLAWLREQIMTSKSWTQRASTVLHLRKPPNATFLAKGTDPSQIHSRNQATVREASEFQVAYSKGGFNQALRALGMQESFGVEAEGSMRPTSDKQGHPHIADLAAAMADACAAKRLSPGRGVVFTISVSDSVTKKDLGGHCVSAYRSHGNTLYFFDANIGVYQVRDTPRFMQAWVDGYRTGRNWTLEVDLDNHRTPDGWMYVVRGAGA